MKLLIIIAVICFASRVFAQNVVQSGVCGGASSGGVFTTGSPCANPITGITLHDTVFACAVVQSGTLTPVVTETLNGVTPAVRVTVSSPTNPPSNAVLVDIVNAGFTTYTLSSKAGSGAVQQRILWAELGGLITAPFDQFGSFINNTILGGTLFGATTNGSLAAISEIAMQCGVASTNESSFGSPTTSGWSTVTQFNTGPSVLMSSANITGTAAVVGTNYAPLAAHSYSLSGIVTYQASAQATPTISATPTATSTGGPTPTATATATCTTAVATATPTPTATPACAASVAVVASSPVPFASPTSVITYTYPEAIVAGHWLGFNANVLGSANSIAIVSDTTNGNWHTSSACPNDNGDVEDEEWWFPLSQASSAGATTITVTFAVPVSGSITFADVSGVTTLDQIGQCNSGTDTTLQTGIVTPTNMGDFLWGGIAQTGSNTFGSIAPSQPTFSTTGGLGLPLEIPLYVTQNNFLTAQATVNVSGTAQDYAGQLLSFGVCAGGGGGSGVYSPPAY